MKIFVNIILMLVLGLVCAIAHERDIYRQCVEHGNSGVAGWTVKFNCSPLSTNQ